MSQENMTLETPVTNTDTTPAAEPRLPRPPKRKKRWGDRKDGRLVRTAQPMTKMMAFIMKDRADALNYFADETNRDTIDRLKAAGLKFESEGAAEQQSDILKGMTIVISGNFSISRDDMKALITSNGGKSSGSISGKTTYLLAGEKAGPEKLKKAESLGVKVISEEEFRKILRCDQNDSEGTQNDDNTSVEFTGTLF